MVLKRQSPPNKLISQSAFHFVLTRCRLQTRRMIFAGATSLDSTVHLCVSLPTRLPPQDHLNGFRHPLVSSAFKVSALGLPLPLELQISWNSASYT